MSTSTEDLRKFDAAERQSKKNGAIVIPSGFTIFGEVVFKLMANEGRSYDEAVAEATKTADLIWEAAVRSQYGEFKE